MIWDEGNKLVSNLKTRAMPQKKVKHLSKLRLNPDVFGLTAFYPAINLKAELGDIIEIDRTLFSHWAIYAGDDNVIHVCGMNNEDFPTETGVIKLEKLIDVAGFSRVRVNNKEVPAKERNLTPLTPNQVVARARAFVGKVVEYNLLTSNCEHYVTEWKYGKGWSDQASVALSVNKTLKKDCQIGHNLLLNSLNSVLNSPVSPTNLSRTPSSEKTSPSFSC
ncbi:HRAS-like suppressor 3 [Limulus polyphemus]|uniref:HRAS-like suppressor 3 n=1 Tax=Limulus polyphemus TaxID=6850 RepID=A0ABM1BH48_LIMPO|nr:HRAS-like suppressor 3 [Limulus polyphemus]